MKSKVVISLLYLYALIFSVLKTVGFPNQWSEAHWMLDYRFGFIKRGLGGEIFGWFFEKSQLNILILSSVILILLFGSLLIIAIRHTVKSLGNINRILFYLIFFLSQYMVFATHIIGYMDNLIFLSTILAIELIKYKQILLASILTTFCILIHELSFFLMLPICFFALIINNISKELSLKDIFNPSLLQKIFLFLLLPFVAMISLSINQELFGSDRHVSIFKYLSSVRFITKEVADSVSEAYTESFKDYLVSESPYFLQRIFVSKASIKYGIPILFLMFLIYKEFRKVDIKILIFLAIISLLPLLLNAIAWDTYRIWSYPYLVLFLGFWILSSKFDTKFVFNDKLSVFENIVLIISIILVSLITTPLFNGFTERFSLIERLLISCPIYFYIFFILKKAPKMNIEA